MSVQSAARKGFILFVAILAGAANDLWLSITLGVVVVLLFFVDLVIDHHQK